MIYPKTNTYSHSFLQDNLMGPNAMKLLEELTSLASLPRDGLVLDLGCGKGLTSIFLADQLGYQVIAADLWIDPTDNLKRFRDMGLSTTQVLPLKAEAHTLPFPKDLFDLVVSVDAYQYFGCEAHYLSEHLLPLVKPEGQILMVVPGVKEELGEALPEPMALSWSREDVSTFHCAEWWRNLISKTKGIHISFIQEMVSFEEAWADWLVSDNVHAIGDRPAMENGGGDYMNLIAIGLVRSDS